MGLNGLTIEILLLLLLDGGQKQGEWRYSRRCRGGCQTEHFALHNRDLADARHSQHLQFDRISLFIIDCTMTNLCGLCNFVVEFPRVERVNHCAKGIDCIGHRAEVEWNGDEGRDGRR